MSTSALSLGSDESIMSALQPVFGDSERRFREMIDELPVAIYTTDAQGRLTHFNSACVAFSGRVPNLGSDHWCVTWKLFYPDGRPMPHDECPMAVALKTGRVIRGAEAIAERPDGTRVWFTPYPTPLFDDDGNITGGINMLSDITERKQREAAGAYLAAVVESSDDAIITKGLDGIITTWNASAQRLFGYTAQEAIGQPITMLIPPDRRDEEPRIIEQLRRGQRVDHFETRRVRKDGSLVDISLTISPVKDSTGRIVGASKVARDITERKLMDDALQEAKQRAEDASAAKDKFLAALSHELRTPLTPVMMSITALDMDPDLPPALRRSVAMIRRNVDLELKLIDDLLDVSRVTAGKLQLRLQAVDMNAAVSDACETCRQLILERGIRLHCHLPDSPKHVNADSARLQQILWNLVRNAAKFTPEHGEIHVTVSTPDEQHVRFEVRDTGIGIEADVLPRIFDAFEQGDASITRQFGGMGLGLAITKALVEMHGGSIHAASGGTQRGATFTVEFPAVGAPQYVPDLPAGRKDGGAGVRILLVEDHADTAEVLAMLLESSGHTVKTAGSAAAALALAAAEPFDVLVSDIGLPDATGYDLMKQIKQRHPMKGVAMSGFGMDEDLRKSREAGFNDHVVKPANPEQLERAIRRVCRPAPTATTGASTAR